MLKLTDEILIFIEDKEKITFNDLSFLNERQTRGAIGKLNGMGYLKIEKNDDGDYYSLSEKGKEKIDLNLSFIQQFLEKNSSWYLAIFNVPESKRKLRDKMRHLLTDFGFKKMQNSVWLSAYNFNQGLKKHAEVKAIDQYLSIFKTNDIIYFNQKKVADLLQLKKTNAEYLKFIKLNKKQESIKKSDNPRFEAKKIIYYFAQIVKTDPKLPKNFLPQDWHQEEAVKIYHQIRSFL